jgi:ABC-type glutathione transport system ATPase component
VSANRSELEVRGQFNFEARTADSGVPASNPVRPWKTSAVALRLTGVSKSFGSVVAVRDVSLALRKGTLTSLLGPSGCGKDDPLAS